MNQISQGEMQTPVDGAARSQMAYGQPDQNLHAPLPLNAHHPAREVIVRPLNHGYAVTVGCQQFAVESVDALLHRLGVYFKAPEETEKKWMSGEWKM